MDRIDYRDGETALTGWLARPEGRPRAAVLVWPTIMNVTPAIERRAAMLADAGYLALIGDFYGQPVTDFVASRPLADALRADVDGYRARLLAGLAALNSVAHNLPRATIGYCMGGQAALELARTGADLVLAASFHGILDTGRAADAGVIRARLLVCHGDADPLVPRSQVTAFQEEMDAAGADWHLHVYSKVVHGFTDPGSDSRGMDAIRYNASADRQSWAALTGLLDELL